MEKAKLAVLLGVFCLVCQLVGTVVLRVFGTQNHLLAAFLGGAIVGALAPMKRCCGKRRVEHDGE